MEEANAWAPRGHADRTLRCYGYTQRLVCVLQHTDGSSEGSVASRLDDSGL